MKGYTLMRPTINSLGLQYKTGKGYSLDGRLLICKTGFNFCENPFDCLKYCDNIEDNNRLFLVETLGEVTTKYSKSVTNKIKIIEEIKDIEKFFEENLNNFTVDWIYLSMRQKLSESFIEKHADKVNWECISQNQKLSESFIKKYIDKVDVYSTIARQEVSEELIKMMLLHNNILKK